MPYAALAIHQLATMTPLGVHPAPERRLTIGRSHTVVHFRRACRGAECPRTATALEALTAAGRVAPSADDPQ